MSASTISAQIDLPCIKIKPCEFLGKQFKVGHGLNRALESVGVFKLKNPTERIRILFSMELEAHYHTRRNLNYNTICLSALAFCENFFNNTQLPNYQEDKEAFACLYWREIGSLINEQEFEIKELFDGGDTYQVLIDGEYNLMLLLLIYAQTLQAHNMLTKALRNTVCEDHLPLFHMRTFEEIAEYFGTPGNLYFSQYQNLMPPSNHLPQVPAQATTSTREGLLSYVGLLLSLAIFLWSLHSYRATFYAS